LRGFEAKKGVFEGFFATGVPAPLNAARPAQQGALKKRLKRNARHLALPRIRGGLLFFPA